MTPRLYVPDGWADGIGSLVEISVEQQHHLANVLRRRLGDAVELFDGEGRAATARLEARDMPANMDGGRGRTARERPTQARVVALQPPEPEPALQIVVGQAISSAERMDWTLEKAVEAGVSMLVPLQSARAAPRLAGARLARRLEHWRRIVVSAAAQSGRNRLPRLSMPLPLGDWIADATVEQRLLLAPDADRSLAAHVDAAAPPRAVAVACGPEAGFDADEVAAFIDQGWQPVSLGPRTLRTETAALVAVAVIQARWGDLR